MWFLGSHKHHKEVDSSESNSKQTQSTGSRGSSKRSRVRKIGRIKSNNNGRTPTTQPVALTSSPLDSSMVDEDSMYLDETYSGIEVSLNQNNAAAAALETAPRKTAYRMFKTAKGSHEQALSTAPLPAKVAGRSKSGGGRNKRRSPVVPPYQISSTTASIIAMQQQVAVAMQKVYRAQFNVSKWYYKGNCFSNGGSTSGMSLINNNNKNGVKGVAFQSRPHRIPLFSEEKKDCNGTMLYDDIFYLLTNQPVIDEETLVQRELDCMDTELSLLEADRQEIEQLAQDVLQSNVAMNGMSSSVNETRRGNNFYPWNLHQQLFAGTSTATSLLGAFLSKSERQQLQEQRGLHLTVQLRNPYAQEALMAKCGCVQKLPYQAAITISPHNCREGGGASTIQHVQLVNSSPSSSSTVSQQSLPGQHDRSLSSSSGAAVFLSRDAGPSYCSSERGGLPDRLYRRLRAEGHQNASNILYLVTGPYDSYYVEFRSGECWWGCPDVDFDQLCLDWDVHRVVFGPAKEFWWDPSTYTSSGKASCSSSPNSSGSSRSNRGSRNRRKPKKQQQQRQKKQRQEPAPNVCFSWLIVSRDGRAAWKNLPARLHSQLSRRLVDEPAPVEFALGPGDSYFVRWLDGTSDWQLSADAAGVCERLDKYSGTDRTIITSVALHHSAPDFVVRHQSVQQSCAV